MSELHAETESLAGQQKGGNAWEAEEPDVVNQGPAIDQHSETPVRFNAYRIGGWKKHRPSWVTKRHDRWFRPWQAEWENGACLWCPRAWTKNGALRKARRWFVRGIDIKRHEKRYGPNAVARIKRVRALQTDGETPDA